MKDLTFGFKQRVIITGGAGFIGSHLADKLLERGGEVVVIDNLSTGKEENLNPRILFFNQDICDFSALRPLFEGVDYVFHLAAIPRVPLSLEDPVGTTHTNILGTVNVFKAAVEARAKRVIFASSSSVYGNQKKTPLKEKMRPLPISPYGLQKLVGEEFAKLFTKIYGVPIISLRYFNVFGPRLDFDSDYSLVIGKFLKQRAEGKPLTIFGDGRQTRGFCFVDDVVEANILALESGKLAGGEVINIGNEESYSINQLADFIGGEREYLPPRPGDVLHTRADISLAKKLLGWRPKVSFEDGLQRTKEWFEEQLKKAGKKGEN